jgi:hypothetical protein
MRTYGVPREGLQAALHGQQNREAAHQEIRRAGQGSPEIRQAERDHRHRRQDHRVRWACLGLPVC